jgi:riboflavin-specific deaminase-like protein
MTSMNLNQQIERWINSNKQNTIHETRPYITLAYAQGLDGSITTRQGQSLSLSGKESIQLTHQLRSLHDGILVGIETVLTDNPRLTARDWKGENPQPIILDSQLRLPESAHVCNHPDRTCWVLSLSEGSDSNNAQLNVITLEDNGSKLVPLEAAMEKLKEMGITSLMVEGGATVITAFLNAKMADSIIITIAPWLIGGYKAVSDLKENDLSQLPALKNFNYGSSGNDLIVYGDLSYGEEINC